MGMEMPTECAVCRLTPIRNALNTEELAWTIDQTHAAGTTDGRVDYVLATLTSGAALARTTRACRWAALARVIQNLAMETTFRAIAVAPPRISAAWSRTLATARFPFSVVPASKP